MNHNNIFLLTWKKFGFSIGAFVIAVILHNVVSEIFHFEEALFFIIAVFLVPLWIVISIIYTLIHYLKKRK